MSESPPGHEADVPDITVIICAYTIDRWELLRAAIRSVQNQEPAPTEILLVIDHCEELLGRTRTLAGVRSIPSVGKPGLSGARNTGIQAARTSVIAFLDDDALAAPGWLDALCSPLIIGAADATGGQVYAIFAAGRPRWFPSEFDWVVGCTYTGHPVGSSTIRNPIGASMAFTREALSVAGPFREQLGRTASTPFGCEETELCIRLRQRWPAARIEFAPNARATQAVPIDRATVRYFIRRCLAEGRSKAVVAKSVGQHDALSSETNYVSVTLPAGIARSVRDTWTDRSPATLSRGVAIVGGLLATTIGYAVGRIGQLRPATR